MRHPWESRDWGDDSPETPPEWDPSKAGPEYHLNLNAPARCVYCSMRSEWVIDEIGPAMVCHNRKCIYFEEPQRP